MPYKSRSQQRKFHALEAQGKISAATVREFDKATDFSHLPERVSKKKSMQSTKAGNTEYQCSTPKGRVPKGF